MSRKSIYLINPATDCPSFQSAEVCAHLGLKPTLGVADLGAATVAAMVPDDFEVSICEEAVSPIDYETAAQYVGITGYIAQHARMKAVAAEFRARGKTVVMGGPYASLSPDVFRSHCDILVRGELENVAAELFADLAAGTWRAEYVGDHPDLARSPLPRWDLYPHHRALLGSVQTSRGCPFACEFCDVIRYLGRQQRHKTPSQVVSELDALYRLGFRGVFLADDNFTANRSKVKELLETIIDWNSRQDNGRVSFDTQLSIDAAKDQSLVRMLSEAGFYSVFVGFETPNADSLREARKFQNLNVDMAALAERFIRSGIAVTGGLVAGFDSDGPDMFERQFDFAMSTAVPVFLVSALYAHDETPLKERLARDNRLVQLERDVPITSWYTNIIPRQMTRGQFFAGYASLVRRLYHPDAFGERLTRLIEQLGPGVNQPRGKSAASAFSGRKVLTDSVLPVLSQLRSLGEAEEQLFNRTMAALMKKPEAKHVGLSMLFQYVQIRMVMDHYLPSPGDRAWPTRASSSSS